MSLNIFKASNIIESITKCDNTNREENSDNKNINNLQNKLKDPKYAFNYIQKNKGVPEGFEIINYIDSGSESVVHSSLISCKNKEGKKKSISAILKLILYQKHEKENKNEINISFKLKNRNVIDFYSYSQIEKNKSSLLVMENAEFGNLRNFQKNILKRNVLSESLLCFLAFQILNGIAYIHKCKIAHMDIKPQNIVIDNELNTKLIDFSISLNYANKNLENEIILPCRGTLLYMSKEVLNSEKIKIKDLNKVDLYSFGVVLYNLAFGSYPYELTYKEQDDIDLILEKMKNKKLDFKNDMNYSSYFIDFLRKLLEKDINKRINIYEALNHYWIKGANLLLDEKEKSYYNNNFLYYLLANHIKMFEDYIHN